MPAIPLDEVMEARERHRQAETMGTRGESERESSEREVQRRRRRRRSNMAKDQREARRPCGCSTKAKDILSCSCAFAWPLSRIATALLADAHDGAHSLEEDDIVTTCEITTYDPEPSMELAFDESERVQKLIMKVRVPP